MNETDMHFTAQDRACMRALGLCIFVHVCTECCVHMLFMLWYVWQSSNCHAHRVACVHAESYLLHSECGKSLMVWVMAMHMDLYLIPLPSVCWATIHNCGIDLVRAHVVLRHCVNCNIGSICCIQCHLVQDPVSS